MEVLFSGKGPHVTVFSPISLYMKDFGEEKMFETVKSVLSLVDPHLKRYTAVKPCDGLIGADSTPYDVSVDDVTVSASHFARRY